MVVQHNISALNANRYFGINNRGLAKSLEKLSSGYAINRAGDNAAGLAVSEKMRSQIAGLTQAVKNAQDGISMVQTFEGALTETDSILQRMKTLATQSANGTYQSEVDRDAIQLEFEQLTDELNQIADTDYNGVVALNGGRMADGTEVKPVVSKDPDPDADPTRVETDVKSILPKIEYTPTKGDDPAIVYSHTLNGTVNSSGTAANFNLDGERYTAKKGEDGWEVYDSAGNLIEDATLTLKVNKDGSIDNGASLVISQSVYSTETLTRTNGTVTFEFEGKTYTATRVNDPDNAANDTIKWTVDGEDITGDPDGLTVTWETAGSTDGTLTVTADKTYNISANGVVTDAGQQNADGDDLTIGNIVVADGVSVSDAYSHGYRNLTYADSITLQVGARSKDAVEFTFAYSTNGIGTLRSDMDVSARGLGIDQLNLKSADAANFAIDQIDNAINKTNMVRATFGAIQNRLEHKIDNLNVTTENLTDAESRIRDTDMASEMMNFTKNQILAQASQSMLAQANQLPQSVLQLLQ